MHFMNRWDIERACVTHEDDPLLGPAARTLRNLEEWTNRNSDGWAYWPKPVRAAARLIDLLDRTPWDERVITKEQVQAALRPIKAFRTRQGADFVIEEIG
jgi:hypothetical protein